MHIYVMYNDIYIKFYIPCVYIVFCRIEADVRSLQVDTKGVDHS